MMPRDNSKSFRPVRALNFTDVSARITKAYGKRSFDKATNNRVLQAFMGAVIDETLKGNAVQLPNDFGVVYVEEREQTGRPPISMAASMQKGKPTRAFNPLTLGKYYAIVLDGPELDRQGYLFDASPKWRKMLNKRLRAKEFVAWTPKRSQ